MEKMAKKILIELSDNTPNKPTVVPTDINGWNQTNDKTQPYRSTPNRPIFQPPSRNPIQQLKSRKKRLMSSPTPDKVISTTVVLQRLPQLKSFREMNCNKENLMPSLSSSNIPPYKSRSVRIRKKDICRINMLPDRYESSNKTIERNIRKQLQDIERKRTMKPLLLMDGIISARDSLTNKIKKML